MKKNNKNRVSKIFLRRKNLNKKRHNGETRDQQKQREFWREHLHTIDIPTKTLV
jgi:hypothetical protein